jgi:hypothetical protein
MVNEFRWATGHISFDWVGLHQRAANKEVEMIQFTMDSIRIKRGFVNLKKATIPPLRAVSQIPNKGCSIYVIPDLIRNSGATGSRFITLLIFSWIPCQARDDYPACGWIQAQPAVGHVRRFLSHDYPACGWIQTQPQVGHVHRFLPHYDPAL